MSSDQNPGWLLYRGDYVTTQLYGDCNKPWNKDPVIKQAGFNGMSTGFWKKHGCFQKWWVSPTILGFPTKNDHFLGWRLGGETHHFGKPPYPHLAQCLVVILCCGKWLTEVMRKATTVKGLVQLRRRRFRLKMLGKKVGGCWRPKQSMCDLPRFGRFLW